MIKRVSRWLFEDVWGWKVSGDLPNISKYLIVVAPHTSNWDFLVGLLYRTITDGFNPKYIGKKELFVWPIGYLFRALGGFPVERSKNMNFVDSMVSVFNDGAACEASAACACRLRCCWLHARQLRSPSGRTGLSAWRSI